MTKREKRLEDALKLVMLWARGQQVPFDEVEKAAEDALNSCSQDNAGYRRGCRCYDCRTAHSAYMRVYMRRNYQPRDRERTCVGCGCHVDSFTLGCRNCSARHSWRRRSGRLPVAVAPSTPWWGKRKEAA